MFNWMYNKVQGLDFGFNYTLFFGYANGNYLESFYDKKFFIFQKDVKFVDGFGLESGIRFINAFRKEVYLIFCFFGFFLLI